jgi:hypothetical protein
MAMSSISSRIVAVCLIAFSRASGGSLQPVWTFDLHSVQGVGAAQDLPIRGLRFSPDGQKIAILAGFLKDADESRISNLFIVGTKNPAASATRIKIATGVDELESGVASNNFQWSPDGLRVFVGGSVLSVPGHQICMVPSLGGFVSNGRVITDAAGDFNRLLEFGPDCQALSIWEPGENWMIMDTSADKDLLLVSREMPILQRTYPPSNETIVVRAADRSIVGRWPSNQGPTGQFADSGRAICGGDDADAADRVPVHCWDSLTGKVIATAPTVNGGSPFAVATKATRMVASDYHRYRIPFTSEYGQRLKQRVVWDFKSGKELASWEPEKQDYIDRSTKTPIKVSDMAKFAISPDGEFLLDGANGVVRLYKIVP